MATTAVGGDFGHAAGLPGRRAIVVQGAVPARVQPLLMEIVCAECGCLVERGVIIKPCEQHPGCCCVDLRVRQSEER